MLNIDARDNETLDVFVKIYDDLINSAKSKFNTFEASRLSNRPQRWAISLYLLATTTIFLCAVLLVSMSTNGISVFYIVSITGLLGLLVATYILIQKEKVSRLTHYSKSRAKALHYEPEGLWGSVHPQFGERGRLIKALLGARHIARTVEETTTVPISSAVIDTMISFLVKGISAAKEDSIHEYYIRETLHLCREIHEYYSRYYPVIELQQLLRYGEE